MKSNIIKLTLIILVFVSCQKEFVDETNRDDIVEKSMTEKTIENGRFVFSSREMLNKTIENLQNEDVEKVEREFEKYYLSGFRSHTPIINYENEKLIETFNNEEKQKKQGYKSFSYSTENEGEGDSDGFILDPYLASFVNNNNELIVNDTLYKFTEELGLFYAHVKDAAHLINYVNGEKERMSESKTGSLINYRIEPCMLRAQFGGHTKVNDIIFRYIRPGIEDDCGIGGGNPSPPTPRPPALPEEERLNNIINNLNICDGRARGNWVQNIFGKSYVCRDYFDRKHRIKTEFWDQNWGFYKSVGILTKTQRKRFWVWWASKSDEIHLGINHIMLKYNFPQPEINSYSHPQLFPKNSFQNPIYMWDGKFEVNTYEILGKTFAKAQLDLPNGKLPFFDFGNKQLLNIYIPKLYKKGKYNLNLTTQDITSQGNIKELYKMGIDFLKTTTGAGKTKAFAVIYQKGYNNIETVYFAERFSKKNANKIKHKFYSSANFTIGYAWNDAPKPILAPDGTQIGTDYSGTGKFKVKPVKSYFRNYTYYKLDFYGMARRGSTWKGNRLIREDKK